jgi:hypothetical protein
MEPRFSLPAATPRSSKRELVIGGVKVYIYGLGELKRTSGVEIGVLYLAHMRTRTYMVTEAIAHEVLHRYRADGRKKAVELIAVTMDMRNHGEREVGTSLKGSHMCTSNLACRSAKKPILLGEMGTRIMRESIPFLHMNFSLLFCGDI